VTDPYQAPPPGGHYRRRAAVVIETAPGMFVQYILEMELPDDAARVEIDYDEPELDLVDFGTPLRNLGRRPHATIELSGRVISLEEAQRPTWADAYVHDPAGQIEAPPRQLETGTP
jgi:hypothetical protein